MKPGHRIVLVEFAEGRPFSVITANEKGHYYHYDFEWCKRDEVLLWSDSGGSLYLEHGDHDYWLAPDLQEEVLGSEGELPTGKRLESMPDEWPLASLFDRGRETEATWCNICEDWLPSSDTDTPCAHLHWCDQCGWWSGEGHDGHCEHGTVKESQ